MNSWGRGEHRRHLRLRVNLWVHMPPQDKRVPKTGSPFQMNFPAEDETPSSMAPLNGSMPTCWDSAQRCSCGDCPDAPRCLPVQAAVWPASQRMHVAMHCSCHPDSVEGGE